MSLLSRIRTTFGEDIGVEVFFAFPEINDEAKTYLDADSASGVTSLAANGTDFSIGQYIVLGNPGSEKTEIVQIHASTPPTAATITLATATVFPHNRGDVVRFIPYNQISAEMATNGVTFSVVSTFNIRADASESYLQCANDLSTYSYRFRFLNSTTGLYGQYSPIVTGAGYADNTVYSVVNRALSQLGENIGDLITKQFLIDALREARRIMDQNPAVFRWSFRTKFGVVIAQCIAGQWQVTSPTDLRDANTNKNLLSLRFGNQNRPIEYQDRRRFNQNYLNVRNSTVAVQVSSGATSLQLASTHDLDASGVITLANNNVGDGLIVVSYTGNNLATNTLTGIPATGTGSINRTVLVGTNVWQQATFGIYSNYTIGGGVISFDTPLPILYDGQDLKGDYYTVIPQISLDSDTFDEPFYDLYVPYLKWKIKYLKANGKIDRDGDTDYKDFLTGAAQLLLQETPNQWVNFVPDVNGFLNGEG